MFSEVRHVGTSLLASAGIVGIIAGVAAQKPLANILAGFQIALGGAGSADRIAKSDRGCTRGDGGKAGTLRQLRRVEQTTGFPNRMEPRTRLILALDRADRAER